MIPPNTEREFCLICNASQLRKESNTWLVLFSILIAVIFILFIETYGLAINDNGIIFILVLTYFIVAFFFIVLLSRNKAKKAEDEVKKFKLELTKNSQSIDIQKSDMDHCLSREDIFSIDCFQCGTRLTLKDKYSQNCGDSTEEELSVHYKLKNLNGFLCSS